MSSRMKFIKLIAFLLAFLDITRAYLTDQAILQNNPQSEWRLIIEEDDYGIYMQTPSNSDGEASTENSTDVLNVSSQVFQSYPHPLNTFQFDDLPLPYPRGILSNYNGLKFAGFQVFDPLRAAAINLTSPHDLNCSTSSPNAIMGSRTVSPPTLPRFYIPEALSDSSESLKFFTLDSIALKGMGYTPRGLLIYINGWAIVDGRAVDYTSLAMGYFREGYQPNASRLQLKKWGWWRKAINVVEIYAQAPNVTDWDFCMDDIEIGYI
jgi:hypothetical protein